jgi:hypothetical protein
MIKVWAISLTLFTSFGFTKVVNAHTYAISKSFRLNLGLDTRRFDQVSENIYFAKHSILDRLLNHGAMYRPSLKTIVLPDNYYSKKGKKNTIATFKEVGQLYGTITSFFHEMGHAEQDVFIDGDHTEEDMLLNILLKTKIKR